MTMMIFESEIRNLSSLSSWEFTKFGIYRPSSTGRPSCRCAVRVDIFMKFGQQMAPKAFIRKTAHAEAEATSAFFVCQ